MIFTGFKTPSGSVASFGNILDHFQFFPNGVWKFLGAFPMVFFAFQGIEFVSITIGETANPREVLPKAINQTIYRILIFYIGAMIIIMSINPWREINPQQSPFVQVFALAGLKGAAGVINFVVLTSAASALNSAIFSAGRHLYQIGTEGHSKEDSKVTEISSSGVPARAIFTSSIVMLLAPALAMIPQIKDAFEFITSSSSDLYILVYALAMVAHYRYRHSADYMPDGFKMPGFPFTNIITIIFFVFIFFTLFINADAIIPAVGAIIWTIVFGTVSYFKFIVRQR
jgi:AAT family amino acid transporter